MAGRRPTPQALKDLAGNPGKRKGRDEVRPQGLASCPTWLAPIAKTEWRRLASELELLGLLGSTDQAALAGYCTAYANLVKAQKVINKNGFTYSHNGLQKKRPEVQIAQDAMREMRKYAQEFGMTPSSRSKVSTNQLPLPGVPDRPKAPQLPGVSADGDPNDRFFGSPSLRAVK
jgi:P27 family predicted phage terminase small subunit